VRQEQLRTVGNDKRATPLRQQRTYCTPTSLSCHSKNSLLLLCSPLPQPHHSTATSGAPYYCPSALSAVADRTPRGRTNGAAAGAVDTPTLPFPRASSRAGLQASPFRSRAGTAVGNRTDRTAAPPPGRRCGRALERVAAASRRGRRARVQAQRPRGVRAQHPCGGGTDYYVPPGGDGCSADGPGRHGTGTRQPVDPRGVRGGRHAGTFALPHGDTRSVRHATGSTESVGYRPGVRGCARCVRRVAGAAGQPCGTRRRGAAAHATRDAWESIYRLAPGA